jgi:hypothetical protein
VKRLLQSIFIVAILINWVMQLHAQVFEALNGFAIEVSLENTGLIRLPIYQNAISSLKVQGDFIIGGTSAAEGLSPYVFVASLSERKVLSKQELNKIISGQQSIRSGFCQGRGQVLFAGTMPDQAGISREGGHLIRVTVDDKGIPEIRDLGIPVPGEGVYTLLSDASGTMLYGISYPSGLFFSYNIHTAQVNIFRDIVPSPKDMAALQLYILKPGDYLCQALVEDQGGLVYGSLPVNKLFCFDPKDKSFIILTDSLPAIWGLRMLGCVDSWAKSGDGNLYGGNSGDGQLFVLNPTAKKITNLGNPAMMNRIRGLAFGRNGKLYGIAGAPPGYTHFFSYDRDNGFHDLGNPQFEMVAPGIEQGIGWRGYNIGTMVSSEDGKYMVMGEDESLSQLLIYIVPPKKKD